MYDHTPIENHGLSRWIFKKKRIPGFAVVLLLCALSPSCICELWDRGASSARDSGQDSATGRDAGAPPLESDDVRPPDMAAACRNDCDCIGMGSCTVEGCLPLDRLPWYRGCPCAADGDCAPSGDVCLNGECAAPVCRPEACDEAALCLFGRAPDPQTPECLTCECLEEPVLCSTDPSTGIAECPEGYLCVPSSGYYTYPPRVGYCLLQCGGEEGEWNRRIPCPAATLCVEVPGWPMGRIGPQVCIPPCPQVKCPPDTPAQCWYGRARDRFGCEACGCAPQLYCSSIADESKCRATDGCRWEHLECADGDPCPQCGIENGWHCYLSGGSWTSYDGCACPAGAGPDSFTGQECVPEECLSTRPPPACEFYCSDGYSRDPASGCMLCECARPADCGSRPPDMCEGLGYCVLLATAGDPPVLECANLCEIDAQCPEGGWCDLNAFPHRCKP